MEQVKLNTIEKTCYYNQSSQTSTLQFCMLGRNDEKEFSELHYRVKCREYFGDVVVASHVDADCPEIYAFHFAKKRISTEELLLSLVHSGEDMKGYLLNVLPVLHNLEDRMGVSHTTIYDTEHSDRLVVVADKVWVSSPFFISIYTALIRFASYDLGDLVDVYDLLSKIGKLSGNDAAAAREINKTEIDLGLLLENWKEILGDNPLTGYDDKTLYKDIRYITNGYSGITLENDLGKLTWDFYANHSQHGIITFCERHRNSMFKRIGGQWNTNYIKVVERIKVAKRDALLKEAADAAKVLFDKAKEKVIPKPTVKKAVAKKATAKPIVKKTVVKKPVKKIV